MKNAENVVLAKLDVDNPEFEEKLVELRVSLPSCDCFLPCLQLMANCARAVILPVPTQVSAVPSIFAYHKGALLASQTGLLPQDAIDALVKELDTRAGAAPLEPLQSGLSHRTRGRRGRFVAANGVQGQTQRRKISRARSK